MTLEPKQTECIMKWLYTKSMNDNSTLRKDKFLFLFVLNHIFRTLDLFPVQSKIKTHEHISLFYPLVILICLINKLLSEF